MSKEDPTGRDPNSGSTVSQDAVSGTDLGGGVFYNAAQNAVYVPSGTSSFSGGSIASSIQQSGSAGGRAEVSTLMGNPGGLSATMGVAPVTQENLPAPIASGPSTVSAGGTSDLSAKSQQAIETAAGRYGFAANAFEQSVTASGRSSTVDPNLLVGLGSKESSLNPSQRNGGLYQIQDPSAYGIAESDMYNYQAQNLAAGRRLAKNISRFGGNVDLGIAAWTLGDGGTNKALQRGGMNAVRDALLSAKHPYYGTVGGYIDFIESFQKAQ